MKFNSIFVTGGAGYVGSSLVPDLLEKGYKVTVYDTMWFGDQFLPKQNKNLTVIKDDIRNTNNLKNACANHDVFLNLACISNDTSYALNKEFSKSVNFDAFEPMVVAAKSSGIRRFIYASTSSVYGISEKKNVREDHPLVPLTLYNKYKGMCEPLLLKHTDKNFEGVIFRPATVCGYAPRQRLDVSVNILTNFAVNKDMIKIFGGDQLRPNLHIKDYCEVVDVLVNSESEKIKDQIFNVGYQNMSINQIANLVKIVVEKLFLEKKIYQVLGFRPRRSIEDAVEDLCNAFKNGELPNSFENDYYFNVKQLKKINAK